MKLVDKLKKNFENKGGHTVKIYTLENLCINESLFDNDFYILKSKNLFFIYAGYYLEANKIPVIPNPDITFKQKNRIEAHFLIKQAGLICPDYYLGTYETLKSQLNKNIFPLIQKPLMGSGSRGVHLIKTIEDLKFDNNRLIYLERYISGSHYIIYFIENEICVLEKPPLSHEHAKMEIYPIIDDFFKVVDKWKNKYNLLFGHLDVVKENSTNQLYIVDPGSFPEFSNWKSSLDPVPKLIELILKEYKRLK